LQASNGATQSSGACGLQVEEDDEESSSSSLTASSAVEVRISTLSLVLIRFVENCHESQLNVSNYVSRDMHHVKVI
jgi:hypothetical protein